MGSLLDLVGVGIDAAQYYQMSKARDQLRRIEEGRLAEGMRKEVLEVLRNFVFETVQDLKSLETHLKDSPQAVYVIAKASQWRFEDAGISAAIFPEFADKEYVQQAQAQLASTIGDAQERLSESQIDQADKCFRFIAQMPLLEQAINAQSAHESLKRTESAWKKASSIRTGRILMGIGVLVVALLSPVFSCLLMLPASSVLNAVFGSSEAASLSGLFMLGGLIIATLGLIGGIVLLATSSVGKYGQLKRARVQWIKALPHPEVWEEIIAIFGEHDSAGYRSIRDTREGFVKGILGQVEGFDRLLQEGY